MNAHLEILETRLKLLLALLDGSFKYHDAEVREERKDIDAYRCWWVRRKRGAPFTNRGNPSMISIIHYPPIRAKIFLVTGIESTIKSILRHGSGAGERYNGRPVVRRLTRSYTYPGKRTVKK